MRISSKLSREGPPQSTPGRVIRRSDSLCVTDLHDGGRGGCSLVRGMRLSRLRITCTGRTPDGRQVTWVDRWSRLTKNGHADGLLHITRSAMAWWLCWPRDWFSGVLHSSVECGSRPCRSDSELEKEQQYSIKSRRGRQTGGLASDDEIEKMCSLSDDEVMTRSLNEPCQDDMYGFSGKYSVGRPKHVA